MIINIIGTVSRAVTKRTNKDGKRIARFLVEAPKKYLNENPVKVYVDTSTLNIAPKTIVVGKRIEVQGEGNVQIAKESKGLQFTIMAESLNLNPSSKRESLYWILWEDNLEKYRTNTDDQVKNTVDTSDENIEQ
jgi:hypothetical protein